MNLNSPRFSFVAHSCARLLAHSCAHPSAHLCAHPSAHLCALPSAHSCARLSARSLVASAAVIAVVSLAGCLDTRSSMHEQDEKVVMRSQVASLQKNTADINSRFQDIEDDIRRLSGKAESTDNRMGKIDGKLDKQDQLALAHDKDRDEKLAAYREDITRLSAEVEQLKTQMAAQTDQQKHAADAAAAAQAAQVAAAAAATEKAAKNPYASAQERFEAKNWKEAILDFEKYRKANPKGKNFPTATYKIGVSFQELGLADDAKAFYEEVVSKFPKSHDAELATKKLKGLKKK